MDTSVSVMPWMSSIRRHGFCASTVCPAFFAHSALLSFAGRTVSTVQSWKRKDDWKGKAMPCNHFTFIQDSWNYWTRSPQPAPFLGKYQYEEKQPLSPALFPSSPARKDVPTKRSWPRLVRLIWLDGYKNKGDHQRTNIQNHCLPRVGLPELRQLVDWLVTGYLSASEKTSSCEDPKVQICIQETHALILLDGATVALLFLQWLKNRVLSKGSRRYSWDPHVHPSQDESTSCSRMRQPSSIIQSKALALQNVLLSWAA